MKSGPPPQRKDRAPLIVRRPERAADAGSPIEDDPALQRLRMVEEWTEEPARKAAEGLPQAEPAPPQPEAPKAPPAPRYPWEGVSEEAIQSYTIDIPKRLHLKMKWLAETTYDQGLRKRMLQAIERSVDEGMRERGIEHD